MDKVRRVQCQYHPLDAQQQAVKEGRSSLVDCFAQEGPHRLYTKEKSGATVPLKAPCATVWAGTSIDYFLLSTPFLQPHSSPAWRIHGIHVIAATESDHLPLVLDLMPTSPSTSTSPSS